MNVVLVGIPAFEPVVVASLLMIYITSSLTPPLVCSAQRSRRDNNVIQGPKEQVVASTINVQRVNMREVVNRVPTPCIIFHKRKKQGLVR